MARRALCLLLSFLAVLLLGTVAVLSTVVVFFGVDLADAITEPEMRFYEAIGPAPSARESGPLTLAVAPASRDELLPVQAPAAGHGDALRRRALEEAPVQYIPKIVHQTWKVDSLPERWDHVRQECMALHPDYEYKLWSDESSRAFLQAEYPWFVATFDGYPYPIQRADAIRYFVLHHYGGVYMDLDVGCRRSMDPLLYHHVILPATIPVGVSNDLMLAEKGHPFMELVIHSLMSFDHQYGTNYPTVMFSTGPMFLSAVYGQRARMNGDPKEVRILPRRWYGKNAPEAERAEAFFTHYYGSSWHSNDAGLITFLGKFGVALMYTGLAFVVLGTIRLLWSKRIALKSPGLGPVALPFHLMGEGLPFARASTPESKGGSVFHSRESTSAGLPSGKGIAAYLPGWLESPGDVLPTHSRPSSPTWREKVDSRYRSVPPSRASSPTLEPSPPRTAPSASLSAWGSSLFSTKSARSPPPSPRVGSRYLALDTTSGTLDVTTPTTAVPPYALHPTSPDALSFRPPLPSYSALDVADCSPSPASLPQMGYCPISQLVTPPRQRPLLQRRKSRSRSLEGSSLSRTTSFTSAYDDEGYDASGSSCGYDSSRHEGDEHTGEGRGF